MQLSGVRNHLAISLYHLADSLTKLNAVAPHAIDRNHFSWSMWLFSCSTRTVANPAFFVCICKIENGFN